MPHRNASRAAAALLLAAVLAAALLPAAPLARAQPPARDKGSPFGMVTAIGNRVRADEVDRYVALLREAGVQWVREEIFWDRVQRQPGGPFAWNGDGSGFYDYDRSIGAQAAAGIHILGLLDYNPAWFKGQAPPLDAWIKDWGDYVYQTVVRYGRSGQIKHWEIWNEPNLTGSGYSSGLYEIGDYARILGVAHDAAKAADPEATIVLGGLASVWSVPPSPTTYDYFDYLDALGKLGAWASFDVVAVHPYRPDSPEGQPLRRDHPETFPEEMRRLDELIGRYGAKPVWLTEIGWPTNRGWPGVPEDRQAQFLARLYVMAMAQPNIEKVFWYDFRNDTIPSAPYDQPVYNDAFHELHYGLLRRTFPLDPNDPSLRKPAFLAYRALTGALAGLVAAEVPADGRRGDMPNTYWYRFAGSRRVDVLWNTDAGNQVVQIPCGCREALVRHWNGRTRFLIFPENGVLNLRLDEQGAPVYVEYDPPAAPGGRVFAETGHALRGAFLAFWQANGGLARFGYPLTEELTEPEAGTGRPRTVQYFERARFEYFPEFAGSPYEVQLGLLGVALLSRFGVDWQAQPKVGGAAPGCRFFAESGHSLCPPFRARWEQLGGLPLLGLPITEPFAATRPDTGQQYTVQYFERARLSTTPRMPARPTRCCWACSAVS
ncbi:glycosyl hydrolase [Kouleothrix sp.]|uniref:glycosyl hydrolase n=1 Tax=Kouleothrix sp. TaxID=2779161 RepID=UPI0039192482